MSCARATPLPWIVETTTTGHPIISGGGGGTVAVLDVSAVTGDPDNDKINAAHIVRCVNAYDELVAALTRCLTDATQRYEHAIRTERDLMDRARALRTIEADNRTYLLELLAKVAA